MKKEKLSWDYMKAFLPDIDHPEFNALRNGDGRMVNIPVTLYKNDEPVLSAQVQMLSSARALYMPALWLLLRECAQSGVDVDWDTASFTNVDTRFSKNDLTDWRRDPATDWMQRYNGKPLPEVAGHVLDELEALDGKMEGAQLKARFNDAAVHMAASFQLQAARILSEDLDALKRDSKWARRTVKGVKAFLGLA